MLGGEGDARTHTGVCVRRAGAGVGEIQVYAVEYLFRFWFCLGVLVFCIVLYFVLLGCVVVFVLFLFCLVVLLFLVWFGLVWVCCLVCFVWSRRDSVCMF